MRIKTKKPNIGLLSTIMVTTSGRSIYDQMDYNELGEPYEEVLYQGEKTQTTHTNTVNKNEKLHLATIIEKSIQREMFIRVQKNLILLKVLADSIIKLRTGIHERSGKEARVPVPNTNAFAMFQQAVERVRASQRRISAIFSPLVFQLYPDQVETLTLYMADITMACAANQDLPVGLFNEIDLPRVQKEFSDAYQVASNKPPIQIRADGNEKDGGSADQSDYLFSREYHLFLAAIYLSETVEQMEKTLGTEVEKLTKLIRPEITALENTCSKIHNIFTKNLERENKRSWRLDFKAF